MELLNIYAAFIGWLAFNVFVWHLDKNAYDREHKEFPFRQFVNEHYDDWIVSLVFVPVLLYLGYIGFGFNPLGEFDMQPGWNDAYYLCSGFAVELVKRLYEKLVQK